MKYYSKSTGGFYTAEIHGDNTPDDAVEITEEYHAELLAGQSAGKIITSDNGYPVLTERLPPTIEDLRSTMVLTPAQARIKLAGLGLLDGIESTIAALPITDVVSIYWYYATEFRRLDSTLIGFCTSTLGMSDEQIDGLFS